MKVVRGALDSGGQGAEQESMTPVERVTAVAAGAKAATPVTTRAPARPATSQVDLLMVGAFPSLGGSVGRRLAAGRVRAHHS
jgi:hypothetical protein